MMYPRQNTQKSKMVCSRGKGSLDSGLSITGELERCSLGTHAGSNLATVEKLGKENTKLKTQYEQLRCQYVQLLEEEAEEKFEERRVNLLKAQVMQLERQVILLSEGLSSQVCRSQDVENALGGLTQRLRSLLAAEASGDDVIVSRVELTQLIERCEDVRRKIYRNNKVTSPEDLAMPWLLSGLKLTKQPTTLLDLCYGKTNNINLQQVPPIQFTARSHKPAPEGLVCLGQSALESKLSQLFKHLHGMRQTLSLIFAPHEEPNCPRLASPPSAVYARLLNQAHLCCPVLDRCCLELLTLSLIVPSAPWATRDQKIIQELEVENILAVLPTFPRGAPLQRARRAAQALSQAANYSVLMAQKQVEALEAELEFHRSLYSLHVWTIEELVQGTQKAYQIFQENISQSLCAPLQDVLSCYEDLRSTASEAALHRFLSAFKSNSAQIQEAVDAFGPSKSEGAEALAQYGQDFLTSVKRLLKECTEKREKAENQLHSLQQEQQQAVLTLHSLRAQRKEASPEKTQLQMSCAGSVQRDIPAALSTEQSDNGEGKTGETSIAPAKQRHRAIRQAQSVDVTMSALTQVALVNQKQRGEKDAHKKINSCKSKSRKLAARPEWQA